MNWMVRSPGDFPVFVEDASGAHFTDVDGHRYVDPVSYTHLTLPTTERV